MTTGSADVTDRWVRTVRAALGQLMEKHDVLRAWRDRAAIILHGSTTRGIDDPWSDLDLWVLTPDESPRAAPAAADSPVFFQFTFEGKEGHFTLEPATTMRHRIEHCDFPWIVEWRDARVLTDPQGLASQLVHIARLPMPPDVRLAWTQWHYTEMRSEHRAADNPIERRDPLALLQATVAALRHALQTAMILDAQPYPYVKWLASAAASTPTGAKVVAKAHDLLDLLAHDALRIPGPEKTHPVSLKLREIRATLIDAMRSMGIDAPWQTRWFLYMHEAHHAVQRARWPMEPAPPTRV